MRIGIRVKLLAGFVATALFTGVLGWYAASSMERLNDGTRTMSVDVFGGTHLLATWLDRSWESRSDLLPYTAHIYWTRPRQALWPSARAIASTR